MRNDTGSSALRPATDFSRRAFLQTSSAAAVALVVANGASAQDAAPGKVPKKVVVVGAGLAGLACAYELTQLGVSVTVLEARDQPGGRVISFKDFIPNAVVEGGGEFIGKNHPTWMRYAQTFNIELTEAGDYPGEKPLVLNGQRITGTLNTETWEAHDTLLRKLDALAVDIDADEPWKSKNAEALDKQSLGGWIDAQQDAPELVRALTHVMMSSDNGVATHAQSLLAFVAMIKGGGGDTFWEESEWYRAKGGNQQLARALANAVGTDNVRYSTPVIAINHSATSVKIICADGSELEVDEVVLSVPGSILPKLKIEPALPDALRVQMGPVLKYIADLKEPVWSEALSPEGASDDLISQTWNGTDGQEQTPSQALLGFAGGPAADRSLKTARDKRDSLHGGVLESLYPGYEKQFTKSRYMDWPADRWSLAGYSFPAPGDVCTTGPILRTGVGRIHFAGEHCSCAFPGYMEGALSSGVRVAKTIGVPT